ncbi:DEAD/DEAH box helicase [Rhizobiaceae bacterium CRRU44]|uniref:DEAD/DEAH box helicase n=1 Tax=Ferranicluibacter rubi TaxID=2715133 RepID=A0AA44CCI9_9HYPH|nr:DEAD/DEAH box helicase [Ferranicluibacter rubi]NHT76491.1 DEAD/DEAH box helicase [Ferranicluibacter rubi]
MTEFAGVVPAIAEALTKRGYSTLTPVQAAVIEAEMSGRDALVSAQTGSGKTVAFGLALASTLLDGADRFGSASKPLAVVVAPTRELALQVQRELEWLYEMTGAVIAASVGGMDIRTERRALDRGAHIVVGTPGRLCDHVRRSALDLSACRAIVLDEADEMLDLGFREDLEFLLETAPADRRTLMFSATVPKSIATLAKNYQRDALRISTQAEAKQHLDIDYRALVVVPSDRENAIINVLRYYEAKNALVFCSTRAAVNHLTARFNNRGFSVVALSGELSQSERTHALQAMRDGRARVCIATDVAARGIDLPGLELVIHADLPTNPDTLLHRSGRTGRAGRRGVSAIIVTSNARRKAERLLRDARIEAVWAKPPSADEVSQKDDERILSDAALNDPIREEETAFVQQVLSGFSAEQVAAAFVRLARAGRSAPEDIIDTPAFQPSGASSGQASGDRGPRPERSEPRAPRGDFGDAVWFSISAGRKQNVEPRWLIPMLCRIGRITKQEIGAIKMMPENTFVEIAREFSDSFVEALGPKRMLEKGITVTQLDSAPDLSAAPRKPFVRKDNAGPSDSKPRWKEGGESADRPDSKPWAKKAAKPGFSKSGPKPTDDGSKPAKKPFKKKAY